MKIINMLIKSCFIVITLVMLFAAPAYANNNSPLGYWQTYDENDQKPSSILHVWENNGVLQGKVVKLFNNPTAVCSECAGEMRNKPVVGMIVMWGFTKHDNLWTNGKVLAIKRGKVFDADLMLTDAGQKMEVRVLALGGKHVLNWTRVQNPGSGQ